MFKSCISNVSLIKRRVSYCLLLSLVFFQTNLFSQVTQTFTTIGSNSFTVPAGVSSVIVECWGGGGAGGGCTSTPYATGGGGAGGSYTRVASLAVVPCSTYNIIVGGGGVAGSARAGGMGGTSSFGNLVTAIGGSGGGLNGTNINGMGADITPGVTFNGGSGGTGTATLTSGGASGAGGGGAGSTGNGGNANGINAGTGGNGGAGASGRANNGAGYAGSAPGGGGSGGRNGAAASVQFGGNGGKGQVSVTYNCPTYSLSGLAATNVCTGASSQISITSSPANLPEGVYIFTYNLSAPNSITGATATVTINASGTGSFFTSALLNQGTTTLTVTSIKSGSSGGCTSTISSNGTVNFAVTSMPSPVIEFTQGALDTISNIAVCGTVGGGGQNDMDIASGNPGGSSTLQWQFSLNGTNWTDAPGPTATSTQYVLNPVYCSFESVPGIYYFRVVITNGNCIGTSNRIKLTVTGTSDLTAGILGSSQEFCRSGDPLAFTQITSATGGSGTYSYQWQSSTDSINFYPIAGATAVTYDPGFISQTTYYRRITVSGGCRAFSNIITIKITLSAPSAPGLINGLSSICSGTNALNYSINPVPEATSYNWSVSGGLSILSGAGTPRIAINAGSSVSGSGISVSGVNICGSGPVSVLPVTINPVSTQAVLRGDSTICSGSAALLVVNVTGGASPYELTISDGFVNTVTSNYYSGAAISVQPDGNRTYSLINVRSAGGCSGTGLSGSANVNVAVTGTWLGKIDNNWNNASNWCGGIPDNNTDAIIPAGSPNTPIRITQQAKVRNLNASCGAGIIISGQTLTVNGLIQSNGNINASNGSIELAGNDTIQTIRGSMFSSHRLGNLKISNSRGVQLSGTNDTLILIRNLEFGKSNCTLFSNGNLTLNSSDTSTASIADMTSGGLFSGNRIVGDVTVERYIPLQSKAWRFLSAPATGRSIKANWQENNSPLSNLNNPGCGTIITSNLPGAVSNLGFDIYTPSGSTIKIYNSANDSWTGVGSTSNMINNAKGYMLFIRGDRSVTAYNQQPTATKLRTSGTLYTDMDNPPPVISVNADKYESAGNPYACTIDFSKVSRTGGIQDVFYLWDPALTSGPNTAYGLGGFQTFIRNGNTYDVIPGGGSYASGYKGIPSGQGFFIRSNTFAGQLSFSENCKQILPFTSRNSNELQQSIRINLSVINNGIPVLLDGIKTYFKDEYSDSIDAEDVLKMSNNISENISLARNGWELSGERRTTLNVSDTLLLHLNQMKRMSYRLDIIAENFSSTSVSAILTDKYLNTSTDIDLDSSHSVDFVVDANPLSYAADRFYITLNSIVTPVQTTITVGGIREQDGGIRLQIDSRLAENGTTVLEKSNDNRNFSELVSYDEMMSKGKTCFRIFNDHGESNNKDVYYRARFTPTGSDKSLISNILKFNNSNIESSVNGMQFLGDRSVMLQLQNTAKGNYKVRVFTLSGQLIEGHKFTSLQDGDKIRINFSSVMINGIYTVVLEKDNSRIWSSLISLY